MAVVGAWVAHPSPQAVAYISLGIWALAMLALAALRGWSWNMHGTCSNAIRCISCTNGELQRNSRDLVARDSKLPDCGNKKLPPIAVRHPH